MNVNQEVRLNLSADGIPPRLFMPQGDANSRTIVATLWDGAAPYNVPASAAVMVRFRKPDGTGGLYDATEAGTAVTASGNTVTAPVATQMLAVAGVVQAEIDIYGTGSGKAADRLATFRFAVEVAPSVYPDAQIISSDYFNLIAATISEASEAAAKAELAKTAAQAAQSAAEAAQSGAESAEQGAQAAQAAAENAKTAAQTAQQGAKAAQDAAEDAQAAAEGAKSGAQAAQQGAEAAQDAAQAAQSAAEAAQSGAESAEQGAQAAQAAAENAKTAAQTAQQGAKAAQDAAEDAQAAAEGAKSGAQAAQQGAQTAQQGAEAAQDAAEDAQAAAASSAAAAAASAANAATSVEGAVKYNTPQTLTDAQKQQARENINAPAPYEAGDNIAITGRVITTKAFPCNPNLLDNWYFANPVNQRGQTSYTGVVYGIDRWKMWQAGGAVTIENGGIVIRKSSGDYVQWGEILEADVWNALVGQTVTMSALTVNGQLATTTQTFTEDGIVTAAAFEGLTFHSTSSIRLLDFVLTGAESPAFLAVKLELGSQQTLAHQENGVWVLNEIPDYGEQLRRCQRYYFKTASAQRSAYLMRAVDNSYLMSSCTFPVTMRDTPSIQLVSYRNPTTGAVITAGGSASQITPDGFCVVTDAGKFTGSSVFQVAFSATADL